MAEGASESRVAPTAAAPAALFAASQWALPAALALFFLNVRFQPKVSVGLVTVDPGDVAAWWALLAAFVAGRRDGFDTILRSKRLWIALGLFVALVLAACFYPLIDDSAYHWRTHFVTWGKLFEFALLGPAAAILLRLPGFLQRLLMSVVLWASVAGAVAIVQFAGWRIFAGWGAGNRQPSFSGIDELGTLGGITLAIAFAGLLWQGLVGPRLVQAALVAGTVCVILSGALDAGIGLGLAALLALGIARLRSQLRLRGLVAVAGTVAVCGIGILALRGGDIAQFARYVGVAKREQSTTGSVQTYSQRLLLLYIGLRVWEGKPVLGAGWRAMKEPQVYAPYLAAAHKRFPDQPLQAFPSATRPWGIDNAYVEVLTDLGIVGLVLFLGVLATGLWTGFAAALRAPPGAAAVADVGLLWLAVAIGVWVGAGLDITGYTDVAWLSLGLISLGAAGLRQTA